MGVSGKHVQENVDYAQSLPVRGGFYEEPVRERGDSGPRRRHRPHPASSDRPDAGLAAWGLPATGAGPG